MRPDPDYDAYAVLPWWTKASLWVKKAMADLADWYNSISIAVKVIVGVILLAVAIVLAIATGGSAVPVIVEVISGVVIGVGVWALTTHISGQQLTWSGLAQAAADSFLFSALFAFVSTAINAFKYFYRVKYSAKSVNTLPNYVSPDGYTLANRGHSIGKDSLLAQNLNEQLAIESMMSNPTEGKVIMRNLGDPRWPSTEGWVKMSIEFSTYRESFDVHYVLNKSLKLMDDFKIKPKP